MGPFSSALAGGEPSHPAADFQVPFHGNIISYPLADELSAGQAAVIDVISEVDHDPFGIHAEHGGDELGSRTWLI